MNTQQTPLSRSEAYEAIIAEESQSYTNMENSQNTQPQATPSPSLSPVQQLNFNIADLKETAMKLQDLVESQERRIIELESKQQQQNTLTEEAAKLLIAILHDQIISEVEESFSGEYIDIEIGSYSDSIRLDSVFELPFIRTPRLSDLADAFVDAKVNVVSE